METEGTYTDIGSIKIIQNVHEPKHWQETSIDFTNETFLFICPGHIVEYDLIGLAEFPLFNVIGIGFIVDTRVRDSGHCD